VQAYRDTYAPLTGDYTQSALNLGRIGELERNVDTVAQLLARLVRLPNGSAVKTAIKASGHKTACTHFDEPSFVDLQHLYSNLLAKLPPALGGGSGEAAGIVGQLKQALTQGQQLIRGAVLANVAGKKVAKAAGISIYFPGQRLHPSYAQSIFAKHNAWNSLIQQLMRA